MKNEKAKRLFENEIIWFFTQNIPDVQEYVKDSFDGYADDESVGLYNLFPDILRYFDDCVKIRNKNKVKKFIKILEEFKNKFGEQYHKLNTETIDNFIGVAFFEDCLDVLNKESGMLALSGFSSDLRDIEQQADQNERADLALNVFAARIHKYLGSYAARMSGLDAIIFTAGVGENSDTIRAKVLNGLEFMGVYWDPVLNKTRGKEAFINYPHSPVKVLIIPTNEEVMIARDTMRLI